MEVIVLSPHAAADDAHLELGDRLRAVVAPVPVRVVPGAMPVEDVRPLPGAALIAGGQPRTAELLALGPSWRWFHLLSSGTDAIEAWPPSAGDPVTTHSRGVNARSVAEWATGAMLYFYRDFDRYAEQSAKRAWQRHWARELGGRTLVVIGAGSAGSEVARLATGLGMTAIGIARSPQPVAGFERVHAVDELDELLPTSDVTLVLLPLTAATRGLLDSRRIGLLKSGSVLLVASRGGIVDESAVAEAVERGDLKGAAFDVFATEPLPADSPLWAAPGILLTPHVAGTSDRFMERSAAIIERIWSELGG